MDAGDYRCILSINTEMIKSQPIVLEVEGEFKHDASMWQLLGASTFFLTQLFSVRRSADVHASARGHERNKERTFHADMCGRGTSRSRSNPLAPRRNSWQRLSQLSQQLLCVRWGTNHTFFTSLYLTHTVNMSFPDTDQWVMIIWLSKSVSDGSYRTERRSDLTKVRFMLCALICTTCQRSCRSNFQKYKETFFFFY